jgi:DNA-binding CsgD family transcriptional regulator
MRRSTNVPTHTVSRFLAAIDACTRAPALPAALEALATAMDVLVPRAQVYFGFYRREAPPIVLGLDEADEWNRTYPDGHYLLDPCYEAFLRLECSACLLPQDVFPAAFRSSEFYLSYYRPYRMVDEVCYLLRVDADLAGYVSVMRVGEAPPFTRAECEVLNMALPAVDIAMRRVHALHAPGVQEREESARALHRHLTAAFEDFGRGALSERESEVTRLLLKGLAPKVVGRMLEIAPGTVRNHIKAIYAKLGVRSQAELLAAFFDALGGGTAAPQ